MNSLPIEVLPFIIIDVWYMLSRNGTVVIHCATFNGVNLPLSQSQKETLKDEVIYILNEDFDNDGEIPSYFNDN